MIDSQRKRPAERPPLVEAHADVALCDLVDVKALTRMSSSWILDRVRDGRFPAPAIRAPRMTRWKVSDIRRWLVEQVEVAMNNTEGTAKVIAKATKASHAAKAKREAQRKTQPRKGGMNGARR